MSTARWWLGLSVLVAGCGDVIIEHESPEADVDQDGLTNAQERDLGTDPYRADTDGDDVNDGDEVAAGTDALDAGG
jgi:hypothetical protein